MRTGLKQLFEGLWLTKREAFSLIQRQCCSIKCNSSIPEVAYGLRNPTHMLQQFHLYVQLLSSHLTFDVVLILNLSTIGSDIPHLLHFTELPDTDICNDSMACLLFLL